MIQTTATKTCILFLSGSSQQLTFSLGSSLHVFVASVSQQPSVEETKETGTTTEALECVRNPHHDKLKKI